MSNLTDTYYAGDAGVGYGTQLEVGDGASPESFEAVADVVSIQPGKMSTATVEKTHLRSPNRHREWLATIRNSEAFTVVANWRPSHESQSQAGGGSGSFVSGGLLKKWINVSEENFQLVIPGVSPSITWPFAGTVTGFQPGSITVDGKLEVTIEITPLRDYSAGLP